MATVSKQRLLTIGTVCGMLKDEFPDISISKIRYLEDQGLLAPRRTQGGYRLFSEDDVERLETILRLQRDEFLPLRVIRQELAGPAARDRKRRKASGMAAGDQEELDLDELCERAEIDGRLARELEEFGLLSPRIEGGAKRYTDRAAPPARVSDGGRSRGRSHRAGGRACVAGAEPGTAPCGARGPAVPRRIRPGAVPAAVLARARAACVNIIG